MTALESLLSEIEKAEAKATPGPWDDKPASKEWLANGPANYDLCRIARNSIKRLIEIIRVQQEALNKTENPTLIEHREPDAQTLVYCLSHLAGTAIARCEEIAGGK